jgi:ferredoxin
MPKITVKGEKTFEVAAGTRLVLALEDNGIDILHRCGGNARCTTCRVQFHEGEPDKMTVAEHDKLKDKGDLGTVRLSCQMTCEHDMTLEVINRLSKTDLPDPGGRPADDITPAPEWIDAPKG